MVVILNNIDVYRLDTASVSGIITNEKRVSSVTFVSVSGQKSVIEVECVHDGQNC